MKSDEAWIIFEAALRWTHVVAAILWVGQTYLFIFFERNIRKLEGQSADVSGSLWMVHGGGYYYLEKQSFAAKTPGQLHWFFWEATVTWISGALLLWRVHYNSWMLIRPEMTYSTAVAASLVVIFGGFVLYSILLRTPLGRFGPLMAVLALAGAGAAHYGLLNVMSTRSAFFHIGATFGTIMAFNVIMGIIPAQLKILKALREGRQPDPAVGLLGPLRSKHNSYLAVPLVFIMISKDYPTISYGNEHATLILIGIVLLGFGLARLLRGM